MQKEGFNKIICEMCDFYRRRGLPMEKLAEAIGISKRTLQKWKRSTGIPKNMTADLLYDFLRENDGMQFLVLLHGSPIIWKDRVYGEFPADLSKEEVGEIRRSFPGPEEFTLLCNIVVYGSIQAALLQMYPSSDVVKMASLVAKYEADMEIAKEAFGLNGIHEWKDRVLRYIVGSLPEEKGCIESLGQEAINAIVTEYRRTKERRKYVEKRQSEEQKEYRTDGRNPEDV
ncbi:MAG: helix-turn-helix transcriptional regulator [Lachnospiraceae bacterium]|nr:helix-turn-helix transcriptional regulator [Lachnospiraceae bacterium]MBR6851922.1 helix-turn-helix transcriptional regulator [Lachnospiraceae bacterium]